MKSIIVAIALLSVITQVGLNLPEDGTLANSLWQALRYFTILTNLIVAMVMLHSIVTGRPPSAQISAAMTTWIIVVGVVYHVLLSQRHDPTTLKFWADHGLHTVVPTLTVLWWGLFAQKAGLAPKQAVVWAGFPVAYLVYALLRGMSDGNYPYFFIDPTRLSWGAVGAWVLGMAALFVMLGLALVFLARSRIFRSS